MCNLDCEDKIFSLPYDTSILQIKDKDIEETPHIKVI